MMMHDVLSRGLVFKTLKEAGALYIISKVTSP